MSENASKAGSETAEVVVDRIENYLLVIQDELNNINAINQDLRVENRKKDSLIESKGAYLKSLRDVAAADVQQLEFGNDAAEEELIFECNVLKESIDVLKMKRSRQIQIEEDNKRLKLTIDKSDKQKQELLTNSQMKEEKALQDAGMLTMQVRMHQQEEGMSAMKNELRMLHNQEETIRTKLGELFEAKFRATNEINALKEQENDLYNIREAIWDEIDAPPTIEDLQESIEDCDDAIDRERQFAHMWYNRLCQLKLLESALRPVSEAEKAGIESSPILTLHLFLP